MGSLGGTDAGHQAALLQRLPWLGEAFRLVGTRERRGPEHNEDILDWATDLDIDYDRDEIPWCGLFVAHCIGSQLPDEPLPRSPLLARGWRVLGTETTPQLGALLVFWRGSPRGWKGHVGFYWGEDDQAFHVLGGNQSNMVSVARFDRARLLEARWPKTGGEATGERRSLSPQGRTSEDEE